MEYRLPVYFCFCLMLTSKTLPHNQQNPLLVPVTRKTWKYILVTNVHEKIFFEIFFYMVLKYLLKIYSNFRKPKLEAKYHVPALQIMHFSTVTPIFLFPSHSA